MNRGAEPEGSDFYKVVDKAEKRFRINYVILVGGIHFWFYDGSRKRVRLASRFPLMANPGDKKSIFSTILHKTRYDMAVDPANVTSSRLQSGYATVGVGTLDSAVNREGDTPGLAFWAATISRSPTIAQGVQNAVSAFFRSAEYSNISNGMCPYSRNNE
jgi:hypothetical protein